MKGQIFWGEKLMNIDFRKLNDKELIVSRETLVALIDENDELSEMVLALQELITKIVNYKDKEFRKVN